MTGYTSATTICYDADGNEIDRAALDESGSPDLEQLDLGDYNCYIQIRNGAE